MRSDKNILIAFILNLAFSIFEFAGGLFTGSVAIISDALHDLGDAASIGISYFLEKKSKRKPDEKYTYGYGRFSVLGSVITTLILTLGSAAVIYNAALRILNPTEIDHNGMIIFAVFGVLVNLGALFFTRGGSSLNQKAVSLHMLEDALGWIVVLIGAFVIKLTDFTVVDPIMSIAVAIFILINAVKGLKEAIYLFLEKAPHGIDVHEICEHLMHVDGVTDVHHVHVWSMDGQNNYATMHIVATGDHSEIKRQVRAELNEHGISHATIELETECESCENKHCEIKPTNGHSHCHHHHHHPNH